MPLVRYVSARDPWASFGGARADADRLEETRKRMDPVSPRRLAAARRQDHSRWSRPLSAQGHAASSPETGLLSFESARHDDVSLRHALRPQGGVDLPAEGGRIVLQVDDQYSAGRSQPRHAVDGEQTRSNSFLERLDVAVGRHGPSEPRVRSGRNRHTMNTTSRSSSTSSM